MSDRAEDRVEELVAQIAKLASDRGRTIAVAESLTGGLISQALAAGEGASDWFRGGIVAYASEVKHDLLQVPEGPVVSEQSAMAMADAAARRLGASLAVAATGVGGPDTQDGRPVGTVWFGIHLVPHPDTDPDTATWASEHHFDGEPEEICASAREASLELLVQMLETDDA